MNNKNHLKLTFTAGTFLLQQSTTPGAIYSGETNFILDRKSFLEIYRHLIQAGCADNNETNASPHGVDKSIGLPDGIKLVTPSST